MDIIINNDDNNNNDVTISLGNYITKCAVYYNMKENINRILEYRGSSIREFILLLEVKGLPECIKILTGLDYYEHYYEMLIWQDRFGETKDDTDFIQIVINDITIAITNLY